MVNPLFAPPPAPPTPKLIITPPLIPKPDQKGMHWAKTMKNIGWDDHLPIGRYKKGSDCQATVKELYASNPGYLLWARDRCIEAGNPTGGFTKQVHHALNEKRRTDKRFASKHMDFSLNYVIAIDEAGIPLEDQEPAKEEVKVKYAGWGAW